MRTCVLTVLGALTISTLALIWPGHSQANHGTAVGIDTDTTGNTPTSLGANDLCRSVAVSETFDVDVWTHDVAGLFAIQSSVYYDPGVIRVVALDVNQLLSSIPAANVLDVSEPVPDSDGVYVPVFLDVNGSTGATGEGVMYRLTIQAVEAGFSPLFPAGNYLLKEVDMEVVGIGDVTGDYIYDGPAGGATIWVGSPCPSDPDGDGVAAPPDNCPAAGNPGQADRDGDGVGDWCDNGDSDGYLDTIDNCPNLFDWTIADLDGDGLGDPCDSDKDGDGVPNASDNAPYVYNPNQADIDGDGIPDVSDPDADGDGINDKGALYAVFSNVGGDSESEYVHGTLNSYFVETWDDGDTDVDVVLAPVNAMGGSVHEVDLDGDGEMEVSIKDPGRAPGVVLSYDMNSADPDSDVDVVVLGGGDLGALVPAPVDLDADGELESLVWEPALVAGAQINTSLDGDGDVDVRWVNGQSSGIDNCPMLANASQANNDSDAYGDPCDTDDDNDGYADTTEAYLATGAMIPCGTSDWPSDFVSGAGSIDRITLTDLTSFLAPVRHFGTSPNDDDGYDKRWDLVPGAGAYSKVINLSDLVALLAGTGGYPPMLGGLRAFGGPPCPGLP